MSAAVFMEDGRFARTGFHVGAYRLRPEFDVTEAMGGPLDAPQYIARGSMSAHQHHNPAMGDYVYVCGTELRPGVL